MNSKTLTHATAQHAAENVDPNTLVEVFASYVRGVGYDSALHCWHAPTRSYQTVSYTTVVKRAYHVGQRLLELGLERQSVCLITCHSPYATLMAFYGAISVGVIPLILPMPKALGSHDALSERVRHWGLRFGKPSALVFEQGTQEKFHRAIPDQLKTLRIADTPSGEWPSLPEPATSWRPHAADIAFFQTTSSSTGDHKAVAISHANILANVSGIRQTMQMGKDERMISWLPLFHDMGLVGAVLFTFCNRYPLYLMTPVQFVKRPALWLRGMSEHRCTIATAPNFGYDYCAKLVSDADAGAFDLSAVKHLFIGAEPIRVSTIRRFVDKFRQTGISEQTMRPAYGLAESTIITSMTAPEKQADFVCLDTDEIGIGRPVKRIGNVPFTSKALEAYEPGNHIAVCSAGSAIANMQIDIVDEEGVPVAEEGVAGEVAVTGTSVALGYVGRDDRLVESFDNGQLRTGDMGVVLNGALYIIERIKNLIIRNGENFLVSALEQSIADVLNVSHDHVAVFEADIHDPASEIVVLIERHRGLNVEQINHLLANLPAESHPIDKIMLSQAREIPRTTSGKKRHFYCRKLYQKSELACHQTIEVTPERIAEAIANRNED